jgi:hypothetical protein
MGENSSITTEYLLETYKDIRSVGIACVYCNYKERDVQSPLNLLASIYAQLLMKRNAISDELRDLYDRHTHLGTRPTLRDISQILSTEIALNKAIYIIVDALDECPSNDGIRETFVSQLRVIASDVRLMVLSRHHLEVLDDFKDAAFVEISAQEEDIRLYLHRKMPLLAKCVQRNEALQKQIADTIVEAVGGM